MKIIKVSEFRTNIKSYLDQCEKAPLIVTSSKGKSYVLQPLDKAKIELNEVDTNPEDLQDNSKK